MSVSGWRIGLPLSFRFPKAARSGARATRHLDEPGTRDIQLWFVDSYTPAFDGLEVRLPPGWVARPVEASAAEFWATAEGASGVLQVSKFSDAHFQFIASQDDLTQFVVDLGERLGSKGQRWGQPAHSQGGECALGRFGLSAFQGGQYPAMVLSVTVSGESAHMWTWLGPDPAAEEVRQAIQIVLEARSGSAAPAH